MQTDWFQNGPWLAVTVLSRQARIRTLLPQGGTTPVHNAAAVLRLGHEHVFHPCYCAYSLWAMAFLGSCLSFLSSPCYCCCRCNAPSMTASLSTFLTVDTGFWGDLALKVLVNVSPSVQWANKVAEPWLGLPFGVYLHSGRPRRQRRLTVVSADASVWNKLPLFAAPEPELEQRRYEQAGSAFLSKLPLDVRMIVYDMVLGGKTFHVSAGDNHSRIYHYICEVPDRITKSQIHGQCYQLTVKRPSSAPREDYSQASGLLPLVSTCRKVYSEAIGVLYGANKFEFTQIHTAFRFLTRMVPQPRLPAIRHFVLKMAVPRHPDLNSRTKRDWQDLFRLFSQEMSGLQSLHLTLGLLESVKQQIRDTPDTEGISWIKPMMRMAVDGYASRRCKTQLVIDGVTHDLVQIYRTTPVGHTDIFPEMRMDGACTTLHQRIRVSLGG